MLVAGHEHTVAKVPIVSKWAGRLERLLEPMLYQEPVGLSRALPDIFAKSMEMSNANKFKKGP